uniref:Uncharacterized protein n=1 Tax=Helicotheca tamesis TaxID=374047 RepID=A0A7S2DVS2_9STRA|eukprot:CAMPEP_0185736884 /NCGR_PEP_ID=MMETSP1171-20130828/29048_1 /TAXON_ID=374046 /ORGANISM="Helicotheca tamensis, Strain CCMP826" /LENGTH=387 /DNA_ID=CAMNT_0028407637 /DNA_START=24 /DNA_END=1187 /DNA_ORIENTATION=-
MTVVVTAFSSTSLSSSTKISPSLLHSNHVVPASIHNDPSSSPSLLILSAAAANNDNKNNVDLEELKKELTAYLKKREEMNADAVAREQVGKVVGGTKGNLVLDFVSGSPNKEYKVEEVPNVFDYDELNKYGYGNLVTPIMNAGGRLTIYKLMNMTPPKLSSRITKPKSAPKLVIDREGKNDQARYSGLKMTQMLDDDEMGKALMAANEKAKRGEEKKLMEEEYVMPFADKRNTGPKQTPDWTPEQLDEYNRKRGEALAWARREREGEFRQDENERLAVEGSLRIYASVVCLFVSFAFGKSTPAALSMMGVGGGNGDYGLLLDVLQAPALALVVAGIGSSVVSGFVLAPGKNRSSVTWLLKGLLGGPLAVLKLRELEELKTRGEWGEE